MRCPSLETSTRVVISTGRFTASFCPLSSFSPGNILLNPGSSNIPRYPKSQHPPPAPDHPAASPNCTDTHPALSTLGRKGTSPPNRMLGKRVCSLLLRKRSPSRTILNFVQTVESLTQVIFLQASEKSLCPSRIRCTHLLFPSVQSSGSWSYFLLALRATLPLWGHEVKRKPNTAPPWPPLQVYSYRMRPHLPVLFPHGFPHSLPQRPIFCPNSRDTSKRAYSDDTHFTGEETGSF